MSNRSIVQGCKILLFVLHLTFWLGKYCFIHSHPLVLFLDSINIKILNAGAWSRASERTEVTLPRELEDYIPAVEEFYRVKHSGRKLQWHHHMSNGTVSIPLGWEEV